MITTRVIDSTGALEIRQGSPGWAVIGFSLAAALAALLTYELVTGVRYGDGIGGVIGGLVVTLIFGVAASEQSHVIVDPGARVVRYRRRWGWRSYEGTLPFDDIARVIAESAMGTDSPSRRIVFGLRSGKDLPMTVSYVTDLNGSLLNLAERLRAILGHAPAATANDRARLLAEAGKTMDGIRELRRERNVSLTEAKRLVEDMRAGPTSR